MNRWCGADGLRQSWCLLTLNVNQTNSEPYIKRCEIGEGNADQLVETESLSVSDFSGESELLHAIGAKLDERRYDDVSLITPTNETLSILRTRFIECNDIDQPTLRGFKHIAVFELLETYFNKNCLDEDQTPIGQYLCDTSTASGDWFTEIEEISVTALWETQTIITPLVPAEALRGTPL